MNETHSIKIAKWVNEYVVKNRLLLPGQDLKIVVIVKNPVAKLKILATPIDTRIYDLDAIQSFVEWLQKNHPVVDRPFSRHFITKIKKFLPIWLKVNKPTIGDLVFLRDGDHNALGRYRGCGVQTIKIIEMWLSSLGLRLGMKMDEK